MTEDAAEAIGWVVAIDSSTEEAGVALSNGRSLAEINWTASRDQTVTVLDQVDRLLSLMRLDPENLAAIAIATGPGMFNGLRVGMSVAKGLVLALGLPLVGVSTLDAAALPNRVAGLPVLPVVAAGRGRLVWAAYEPAAAHSLERVEEPRNGTVQELVATAESYPGVIVCGELTEDQAATLSTVPGVRLPAASVRNRRAAAVVDLARARLTRGEVDDPVALEPLYLHVPGPTAPSA